MTNISISKHDWKIRGGDQIMAFLQLIECQSITYSGIWEGLFVFYENWQFLYLILYYICLWIMKIDNADDDGGL